MGENQSRSIQPFFFLVLFLSGPDRDVLRFSESQMNEHDGNWEEKFHPPIQQAFVPGTRSMCLVRSSLRQWRLSKQARNPAGQAWLSQLSDPPESVRLHSLCSCSSYKLAAVTAIKHMGLDQIFRHESFCAWTVIFSWPSSEDACSELWQANSNVNGTHVSYGPTTIHALVWPSMRVFHHRLWQFLGEAISLSLSHPKQWNERDVAKKEKW
jgi:hypothetical protein